MRRRGSHSWELRAYLGTDPETGKCRYATRTVRGTKRAAQRALVELVQDAAHAPRGPEAAFATYLERHGDHFVGGCDAPARDGSNDVCIVSTVSRRAESVSVKWGYVFNEHSGTAELGKKRGEWRVIHMKDDPVTPLG